MLLIISECYKSLAIIQKQLQMSEMEQGHAKNELSKEQLAKQRKVQKWILIVFGTLGLLTAITQIGFLGFIFISSFFVLLFVGFVFLAQNLRSGGRFFGLLVGVFAAMFTLMVLFDTSEPSSSSNGYRNKTCAHPDCKDSFSTMGWGGSDCDPGGPYCSMGCCQLKNSRMNDVERSLEDYMK